MPDGSCASCLASMHAALWLAQTALVMAVWSISWSGIAAAQYFDPENGLELPSVPSTAPSAGVSNALSLSRVRAETACRWRIGARAAHWPVVGHSTGKSLRSAESAKRSSRRGCSSRRGSAQGGMVRRRAVVLHAWAGGARRWLWQAAASAGARLLLLGQTALPGTAGSG